MNTSPQTDRNLLLAFIDGDEAAFNEFYHRFRQDVRNVVHKYHTPNFHYEIEDICQHFWAGLLQYVHSYDSRKPVRNWLISAAVKLGSCSFASRICHGANPHPERNSSGSRPLQRANVSTPTVLGPLWSTLSRDVTRDRSMSAKTVQPTCAFSTLAPWSHARWRFARTRCAPTRFAALRLTC